MTGESAPRCHQQRPLLATRGENPNVRPLSAPVDPGCVLAKLSKWLLTRMNGQTGLSAWPVENGFVESHLDTESGHNLVQLPFSEKKKLRSARTEPFLPPRGDPFKSVSQPGWEPKGGWSCMRFTGKGGWPQLVRRAPCPYPKPKGTIRQIWPTMMVARAPFWAFRRNPRGHGFPEYPPACTLPPVFQELRSGGQMSLGPDPSMWSLAWPSKSLGGVLEMTSHLDWNS